MELTLNSSQFNTELSLAMSAVENKATVPVSGMIHLETKGQFLIITSTNLDFAIRAKVPANTKEHGSVIVEANRLHGWISRLPDGEVSVKVGKRVTLRQGRSNCSINVGSNFPTLPEMGKVVVDVDSERLASLLSNVSFAIAPFEDSRFNYSAAELRINPSSMTAAASGGNRLAVAEIPGEFGVDKTIFTLISKKAVSELSRLAYRSEGPCKIYLSQNNSFFVFGSRLVYCRALAGNFPNWRVAMPKDENHKVVTVSAVDLSTALDRVGALSDGSSRRAKFQVVDGSIKISSDSDSGDGYEEVDAQFEGEGFTFYLNYSWVVEGLRAIGEKQAELRFTSPMAPVELRTQGSTGYRYLIAPMDPAGKSKAA